MDSLTGMNHQHQYHGGKSSASYSVWSNFFLAAGIPSAVATEYAVTFSQHRIQINMLKEINKEILIDMGIKAMGDIIAILRHAKDLCTQDELKSGGLKAAPLDHAMELAQHHPQVSSINQRTSATTARSVPSILSLVGSKIPSRSDNVARTSISSQILEGKRPNNISYVESKRLRLDQNKQQPSPATEKTLTVRYPSAEAMAKVQQRMFEARGGITTTKTTANNLPSIKSRLGVSRSQTSTQATSVIQNNNNNNSFVSPSAKRDWQQQQRRPTQTGNGSGGIGKYNNTQDNNSRYSANRKSNVFSRDDVMRSRTNRLKSTVFNRLGEGPG